MIVTIHQPEHFPYMGFFQKMERADLFVILDNVNYRKNYYQNRNKFLNKNKVEEWFSIPVEKGATKKWIKEVKVNSDVFWKKKLLNKLKLNFKQDFSKIYDSDSLIDINIKSIKWGREKLNIKTPMVYASELNVNGAKSELLANLCKELKATEYLSGPSGKDYLKKEYFTDIKISYYNPNVINYYSSIQNLSK
jgi:hypothetical protein